VPDPIWQANWISALLNPALAISRISFMPFLRAALVRPDRSTDLGLVRDLDFDRDFERDEPLRFLLYARRPFLARYSFCRSPLSQRHTL